MKTLIAVALVFFHVVCAVQAQETFTAFGSTVTYTRPDPDRWVLVHNGMEAKSNAFLIMFQHKPVQDAQGRDIEPVMAAICERVPDSLDVIKYSIAKRLQAPFDVKKMLSPQGGDFAWRNSVGYEGEYQKGSVVHKVFVAHMRHGEAGLQSICDATEGVYDKVQADMRDFLRSITFKK